MFFTVSDCFLIFDQERFNTEEKSSNNNMEQMRFVVIVWAETGLKQSCDRPCHRVYKTSRLFCVHLALQCAK